MKKIFAVKSGSKFAVASICLLAFFGMLAYLFPYSGDDWAWGSYVGIERLEEFFALYNGRYLGNLLVLTITRNRYIRAVFMGVSYYLVCLVCYKYAPAKKVSALIFSAILFLLIPRAVFAQSIVWTSGYSNYVPSAIISAVYLVIIKNITDKEPPEYHRLLTPVTFLLGFCGAPFIENVALFNVFLGLAVIIYTAVRFKRAYVCHFSFLAGAVAGCFWMFSNSAYGAIAAGTDSYRDVTNGIDGLIETVCGHIKEAIEHLFISNGVICVIISGLLIFTVTAFLRQGKGRLCKGAVVCVLGINCVSSIYILYKTALGYLSKNENPREYPTFGKYAIAVVIMYVFTTFLLTFVCVEKGARARIMLPLCCVPVIVAPLLVVNPIGPRCFFASYLFIMLFAVSLFSYAEEKLGLNKRTKKIMNGCLIVSLCLLIVCYTNIFMKIYACETERNEIIKEQLHNGEDVVFVPELPHSKYVWIGDPSSDLWERRYKNFYGIDKSCHIEVLSEEEFREFCEKY